jgi:DNA primase
VAIEPNGLDPCDLRLSGGDQAIRDLIAARIPLYRFVMSNIVSRYDLDHADARLAAVREAAPLVRSIRDRSQVETYIIDLAFLVGLDQALVRRELLSPRTPTSSSPPPPEPPDEPEPTLPGANLPAAGDRRLLAERDTLKLILQAPAIFEDDEPWFGLAETDFTHGAYRALYRTIQSTATDQTRWPASIIDNLTHADLKDLALQLCVEPPLTELNPRHAREYVAKLKLVRLEAELTALKATMSRTNPLTNEATYQAMFQQMVNLEVERKALIRASTGD